MGQLDKRFPLYRHLLKLYPPAYRHKYQGQILQTLADMLDDEENSAARVWTRAALDLPFSIIKQNLTYEGVIMKNHTPGYVKRNSLLAAGLISPFFIIVIANSLDNHNLPTGGGWNHLLLFLILGLPALGLLLSLATFARWAAERRQAKISFWRSLFDIRRNWPLAATAGLALLIVLFIPFHDSGPCIDHNPLKTLRNFDQTMHCIQRH